MRKDPHLDRFLSQWHERNNHARATLSDQPLADAKDNSDEILNNQMEAYKSAKDALVKLYSLYNSYTPFTSNIGYFCMVCKKSTGGGIKHQDKQFYLCNDHLIPEIAMLFDYNFIGTINFIPDFSRHPDS